MQGQWMLLAILVAAYATLNRNATILLFFIIPVPARWYLWLEILFAFLAFLQTKDLAGFLGLCAGVGCTYAFIVPGGWRRLRRDSWLRLQAWWLRQKMNRLRRKRGFTVVGRDDRYIH